MRSSLRRISAQRALIRRGSVALFAQGVSSLSNLMVGVVVAQLLGPGALGRFALLFTLLLMLVAWQTSWVGDSLTVLDRHDPAIRSGLWVSQWGHMAGGVVVGGVIAFVVGGVGVVTCLAFALLVVCWELEEFGRRTFMARLEFGKQALNDGSYLAITAACLGVLALVGTITLTGILCAMAIGAFSAFWLGRLTMPAEERLGFPTRHPDREGVRTVTRYGFWRGAQAGSGYLSQVVVRSLVIALASAAIMGQLEAARLVTAPLFTLIAALTNVTLASFANSAKANRQVSHRLGAGVAICGLVCVVYGVIVLAIPHQLVHLIAGSEFNPGRVVLIGWLALALALALSTPFGSLALVVAPSSDVFRIRMIGSVLGVALTAIVLLFGTPNLMPSCLAAGAAASGIGLWFLARRGVAIRDAVNGPIATGPTAARPA